jgi:hypothetical protein
MKKLLFLILFFSSHFCIAQNYNCLQGDAKHFYTNSYGFLRSLSIDSLRGIGPDTVYYPLQMPLRSCMELDLEGNSWVGNEVTKQADGTFIFITASYRPIIIKTQATPGDSWTFYTDTGSRHYVATLVSETTMTFIGITDSVKRIKIESYIGTVLNTADPINGFEILLSKNNGFVKIFDLFLFPYNRIYPTTISPCIAEMSGGNPGTITAYSFIFSISDYHTPTNLEIFDYSVGDVFVTRSSAWCHCGSHYERLSFDSITGKTIIDPYHTRYTKYTRWKSNNTSSSSPPIYTNSSGVETSTLDVDTAVLVDLLSWPQEENTLYEAWYYLPNDNSNCMHSPAFLHKNIITFEGCDYVASFKAGLEQVTEAKNSFGCGCHDAIGCDNEWGRRLLYSEKDGIPCGTPIYVGVNDEPDSKTAYAIYPNPVTDFLHISAPVTITSVSIYNLTGQVVFYSEYTADNVKIEVSGMPQGMYFVRVNNIAVRKFVKM